jgi:TonB family protein
MQKRLLSLFLLNLCIKLYSQLPAMAAAYEAHAIGGKPQIEQVLETQLYLPKALLLPGFDKEVRLFFDLDSAGFATNLILEAGLNNVLRSELKRVLAFIKFEKRQSALVNPEPYWLVLRLSTDRYNAYLKQKTRWSVKKGLEADSSLIIYSKASKSPEYFRNGDEGLADFILSEIEYPKLAIEKSIEGTVILEFVVETNGFVTGIHVKQGVNGGCTEEAIRLIKKTKWQPAVLNNKLVRYKTIYPITFSLRNSSKDGTSTFGN